MYIFEPNRYKSVPFEKVPPQWQLLYLYFWECSSSEDSLKPSTDVFHLSVSEVIQLICWMFFLTESQTDRAGRAQSWRGEGHSVAGRGRQRYSGWKQSWISHDWLLCKSEFTTQMCVAELIWNGLLFVCVCVHAGGRRKNNHGQRQKERCHQDQTSASGGLHHKNKKRPRRFGS